MRTHLATLTAFAIVTLIVGLAFIPGLDVQRTETVTVSSIESRVFLTPVWTATDLTGRVFLVSGDTSYNVFVLRQALETDTPVTITYLESPWWVLRFYPLTITAVHQPK